MKALCVRQSARRAGVTFAPRWGGGAVGGEMLPMRQRALSLVPPTPPRTVNPRLGNLMSEDAPMSERIPATNAGSGRRS
jgi:hypothetical protein